MIFYHTLLSAEAEMLPEYLSLRLPETYLRQTTYLLSLDGEQGWLFQRPAGGTVDAQKALTQTVDSDPRSP